MRSSTSSSRTTAPKGGSSNRLPGVGPIMPPRCWTKRSRAVATAVTAPNALGAGGKSRFRRCSCWRSRRTHRSLTMSFELKADASLRKSLRRIGRKQLGNALKELTEPHQGLRDEVVHDARKALKRVRAMLRLARPVVGEKVFQRENTCFRDAARPLTAVRDARILVETLDKLIEHFKGHFAGQSFSDVRKSLQAHLREVRRRVLDEQNAFAVVAETIRRERDGVKGWMKVPNKWRAVGLGLKETYRRAKDSFEVAKADPRMKSCMSGVNRLSTCSTSWRFCGRSGPSGRTKWSTRLTRWGSSSATIMTWWYCGRW